MSFERKPNPVNLTASIHLQHAGKSSSKTNPSNLQSMFDRAKRAVLQNGKLAASSAKEDSAARDKFKFLRSSLAGGTHKTKREKTTRKRSLSKSRSKSKKKTNGSNKLNTESYDHKKRKFASLTLSIS